MTIDFPILDNGQKKFQSYQSINFNSYLPISKRYFLKSLIASSLYVGAACLTKNSFFSNFSNRDIIIISSCCEIALINSIFIIYSIARKEFSPNNGQDYLLRKISNLYKNIFPPQIHQTLKDGHCAGFASLWLICNMIKDQYRNEHHLKNDINWFNKSVESIKTCSKKFQKTDQSEAKKNIEQFTNWVLFFQSPLNAIQMNLEKSVEILVKDRIVTLEKNFSLSLSLSKEEIIKSFKTLDENNFFDNQYSLLFTARHCMAMIKCENKKWRFYDSNSFGGEKEYDSIEDIINKVIRKYQKNFPAIFKIISFSFNKQKRLPLQKLGKRLIDMCLQNKEFLFHLIHSVSRKDLKKLIINLLKSEAGREILKNKDKFGATFLSDLVILNPTYLKDIVLLLLESEAGREILKNKYKSGSTFLSDLVIFNPTYLKDIVLLLLESEAGRGILKNKDKSGSTFLSDLVFTNPTYLKDIVLLLLDSEVGREILKNKDKFGATFLLTLALETPIYLKDIMLILLEDKFGQEIFSNLFFYEKPSFAFRYFIGDNILNILMKHSPEYLEEIIFMLERFPCCYQIIRKSQYYRNRLSFFQKIVYDCVGG